MAGKPIRDKDIPGKQVNGQKGKKKCHVLGITEEGVISWFVKWRWKKDDKYIIKPS